MRTTRPIGGLRRQQAERRRRDILRAALDVFGRHGFAGATIREIAEAARVPDSLIYHYFANKQELADACWAERLPGEVVYSTLLEVEKLPLGEGLHAAITGLAGLLYERRATVRLWTAAMLWEAPAWSVADGDAAPGIGLVRDSLRRRKVAGEIWSGASLDGAATLIVGCAYTIFLLHGKCEPVGWAVAADREAAGAVQALLCGIAPRCYSMAARAPSSSRGDARCLRQTLRNRLPISFSVSLRASLTCPKACV